MQRVCFTIQLRPDRLDEYRQRHSPVPVAMLEEIERAGRRNYSLFVTAEGLLVGYYETEDDDAARAYLAASPIASAWEAVMAQYFLGLDDRADQAEALTEVFNLSDQLRAARSQKGSET